MSEMKFVESVKVGDRVRVEGFGINQTPNGREPAVLQGQVARIAWCSAEYRDWETVSSHDVSQSRYRD